ncbi:hypothetical protein D3C72_1826980 [compost metagenome]
MVWPVRSCHSRKVSIKSGAEPEMKRRMFRVAALVSVGSASMRTYRVGTPMKTVAHSIAAITALGSNLENQTILLPLSSAAWMATNRPCTWKIGSAWISTSPSFQPQ